MITVELNKPKISVNKNIGSQQASTTLYNAHVLYNDHIHYGGADRLTDLGPLMILANQPKPHYMVISDLSSVPSEVTLYAGMPMGLLLAITYPTAGTVLQ